MNRLLEILLGVESGFLAREGDLSLEFHPNWPWSDVFGNAAWNLLFVVGCVALVIWVYRREGKSRRWRLLLAGGRLALLLLLLTLLNRPALALTRTRVEPSIVAVLVDDSGSMRVRDVEAGGEGIERLTAARDVLGANDRQLLRDLGANHDLRYYRFNREVSAMSSGESGPQLPAEAVGGATSVDQAVGSVAGELQGQNLSGIVVFTDGKNSPQRPVGESRRALSQASAKVYPVAVGGEGEPRNIEVQAVTAQDIAFAGDIVNVVATVRAVGFEGVQPVSLALKDSEGELVLDPDGNPVVVTRAIEAGVPTEVELPLEVFTPGVLDLIVEAEEQPGEIDPDDNRRAIQVEVMNAQIAVLYVDGYPRWEYRFLKNQVIRDSTIVASILLTSADPTFAQEGNIALQRFPVTAEELLDYDVVLLGDVSPQQFSDGQLELIEEFVSENGGGLGMVAGPRSSPWEWLGTPIEQILPIDVVAEPSIGMGVLAEGYRPVLSDAGERSGVFRFRLDREENERYLAEEIQPLFWWAEGIIARPGVGEVLAQHPDAAGPDGKPAPLMVTGRYGAGRTLFNAMDESWRWRYYTGEAVFDTFWVQQLRFLARGRKLGQRRLTFSVARPVYELGEQVQSELRVLDANLARELPDRLDAELRNDEGQVLQTVRLVKRASDGEADRYTASIPADRVGNFTLTIPPVGGIERADTQSASGDGSLRAPFAVEVPQLELDRPIVDRPALRRLAQETGGQMLELNEAGRLPELLPSAARRIPVATERSLWDAPLALILIATLLIGEWVGRKVAGLI